MTTEDGDQKGVLPAESTKPGSVTTKTIKSGNKTTTLLTQLERCDDKLDEAKQRKSITQGSGAIGSKSIPDEDSKRAIISSKMLKDGKKAVRLTVTLIKSPDEPTKDDKKLLEQTIDSITDLEKISQDTAKPCTINTKSVKDGNKTITTTTTVIPFEDVQVQEGPASLENVPCKVTTKTVKDGKKECLIMTTLVISQDPEDVRNLASLENGPSMSEANPGTFSRETIEDGDDKISVATTKVTVEDAPSKKKGKDKNKDKKPVSDTKPGIVTTKKVKDRNKPVLLTTTFTPIQGTPKGYESNILDLLRSGFPGFNTVSEEDAKSVHCYN